MTDLPLFVPPGAAEPNFLLDTDSYKLSHFSLYPEGLTRVYSYIESRGGSYPAVLLFGLQRYLAKTLAGQVVTADRIDEASAFAAAHGLPFNEPGWDHILNKHGGRLPLRVRAAPEGLEVPVRNALVDIENTDDAVPWLTSYVETSMLRDVWYGSTVLTRIFNMKRGLKPMFERTSDNPVSPFAVLDFSSRGCAGLDANEIGGGAYLACFLGSDSVPAVRAVNRYYLSPMSGFSVSATEHSIMCAFGRSEAEETAAFRYLLRRAPRGSILSVVSDTWSIYEAVDIWCSLAEEVKAAGVTLVIRPDSGEPADVLSRILPQIKSRFGGVQNSKGFTVLDSVKVLWGDGIDEFTYLTPFEVAEKCGIAADSVMVGSGGGLMQVGLNRDTCKWAMKASEMVINGARVPIYKDPVTDPGKVSKSGRFGLIRNDAGHFVTINRTNDAEDYADLLETRFLDGELIDPVSIDVIRERVDAQL